MSKKLFIPQVLDSGTAGVAGLQFVRMTSATSSTAGVAYAGIDVSGNMVIAPTPASGGGQGTSTINFGAFPGGSDATSVINGQTGITAASIVRAWIVPTTTADHTADEHMADAPQIFAGNIVPGVGFTIYGVSNNTNYVNDYSGQNNLINANNNNPTVYGLWSVAWQWS